MASQGHNRLVMTDSLAKDIRAAVSSERRNAAVRGKLLNHFRTCGIKWTDFISPKSEGTTATQEWWDALREQIVAGFTVADQNLIKGDPRKMTEKQKERRKYAQQQIGARISDFKKGLRPAPESGGRKRPVGERLADECTHMEKTISALDGDYADQGHPRAQGAGRQDQGRIRSLGQPFGAGPFFVPRIAMPVIPSCAP